MLACPAHPGGLPVSPFSLLLFQSLSPKKPISAECIQVPCFSTQSGKRRRHLRPQTPQQTKEIQLARRSGFPQTRRLSGALSLGSPPPRPPARSSESRSETAVSGWTEARWPGELARAVWRQGQVVKILPSKLQGKRSLRLETPAQSGAAAGTPRRTSRGSRPHAREPREDQSFLGLGRRGVNAVPLLPKLSFGGFLKRLLL